MTHDGDAYEVATLQRPYTIWLLYDACTYMTESSLWLSGAEEEWGRDDSKEVFGDVGDEGRALCLGMRWHLTTHAFVTVHRTALKS